jgi:hypothetical protein
MGYTPAQLFPEWTGNILPSYRHTTLSQLLRYRSGLPAYTDTESPDFMPDFGSIPVADHIRHFAVWLIQHCTPLHSPGDMFAYSNAGYSLAAAISERTTNRLLTELVHVRFLKLHLNGLQDQNNILPVPFICRLHNDGRPDRARARMLTAYNGEVER